MKKYGINKVRGGTYTQLELPDYRMKALEKELCSASNLCFRCNRQGHFASQCFASTKLDGSPIIEEECWCCEHCDKEFATEYEAGRHEKICRKRIFDFVVEEVPKRQKCFRCGRMGHYANECYASSHIGGKRLYY